MIENRNNVEEEEIPMLYYGNQICMLNDKESRIDPNTTKEEFDYAKSLIEYWKTQYVKTNDVTKRNFLWQNIQKTYE